MLRRVNCEAMNGLGGSPRPVPKQSRGELRLSSERPSHGRLGLVRKRSGIASRRGVALGLLPFKAQRRARSLAYATVAATRKGDDGNSKKGNFFFGQSPNFLTETRRRR